MAEMTPGVFWWDVLYNAAVEDWQMLYEPLGWARTQLRTASEEERQRLAEETLRDLYARGLIWFFRVGPDESVNDVGSDPSRRLSQIEVERVISGEDWRTVPVGPDGARVYFGATGEGERVAKNPPVEVVTYWNARSRSRTDA